MFFHKIRNIIALLVFVVVLPTAIAQNQKAPYVILISFDGFRWDYLNRGNTPTLESLRSNGTFATSLQPCYPSLTFPNHYAIITGMYPQNHGLISNHFKNPSSGQWYHMGDKVATTDAIWYQGEPFWETVARSGIVSASYFWVGSEQHLPERRPAYYEPYNRNTPYTQVMDTLQYWLTLPEAKRPHFITLYFHEADDAGHAFGPDAPQTNNAIKKIDTIVTHLLQTITQCGLRDSMNLIFVSDHGMTNVPKNQIVNIEQLVNDTTCAVDRGGELMMIMPTAGTLQMVYQKLKAAENHYHVYLKNEIPAYYHYNSHPFIAPLLVVADPGWLVLDNIGTKKMDTHESGGAHGFDNHIMDMHGIFIANGPLFKKQYRVGMLENINIYPLLCSMFGIAPRSNIDGKIENISFILK